MRFLMFMAIASLGGCAFLTTTSLPARTVDESFSGTGMNWTSGDAILFSVKAFESNGHVGLCGIWSETGDPGGPAADLNSQAVASMTLRLGDEAVLHDLSIFSKSPSPAMAYPTGQARCVETSTPWSADFDDSEPGITMSKRTFTYYD